MKQQNNQENREYTDTKENIKQKKRINIYINIYYVLQIC